MDVESRSGKQDEIDHISARPNFTLLVYPWKLLNVDGTGLRDEVVVDQQTPPTFLVHAHNDRVTPLSSIEYYKAMKRLDLPAELHIFEENWMRVRGLLKK